MKNDNRNTHGEALQSALTRDLLAVDPDCCYLQALYKAQRRRDVVKDILGGTPPDTIEQRPSDEVEFNYQYRQN